MNSDINFDPENNSKTAKCGSLDCDMFLQMDKMGINPDPFIEIAAHDLVIQFGNKALAYSYIIADDFRSREEYQSAKIWDKIISYLDILNGDGDLIAH